MKRMYLFAVATLCSAANLPASAGGVSWSVGIGVNNAYPVAPSYYPPPAYYSPPPVYYPPSTYYQPPSTYYYPPPAYYPPPLTYYQAPPVVYAPSYPVYPAVTGSVQLHYGHGYHGQGGHHHGHR